jgi:hypothetical protein
MATDAEQAVIDGRLDDAHDLLMRAAAASESPERHVLHAVHGRLEGVPLDDLSPRPLVALRLVAAAAYDAAWQVLRDNAVGVVDEDFDVATSSGARRTSWRLPLTTLVEPPTVFAWLPGFRDPRYDAPESAYDVTDRVTLAMHLDEMWWDGPKLTLAGSAFLRHVPTSERDEVRVEFAHADGRRSATFAAARVRRPDFVTGTGEHLVQRAWAGWAVSCDVRRLRPAGLWKPTLRLTQQGITRSARLAPARGDAVAGAQARVRLRRAVTRFSDDRWLDVLLVDPLPVRAPLRVLQVIADRASGR